MNLVDDIPTTTDDFEHVNCIIEIPISTQHFNEDSYRIGKAQIE